MTARDSSPPWPEGADGPLPPKCRQRPTGTATYAHIPGELRALDRWVVWRREPDPEKPSKPRKPPYRVDAPDRLASSTTPETWATFDEAVSIVEAGKADGIGFALGPPYVGIDLDEELPEVEQHAILLALDSYSERSSSGAGHHVIVRASLNGRGRHPAGIGVFQSARFLYCTGLHVRGMPTTIEERQAQLERVLAEYLPEPEPRQPLNAVEQFVPVDLDDQELLERGFAAKNGADFRRLWDGDSSGYPSQSEADLALCGMLAFWTGGDPGRIDSLFRCSSLMRPKWDEPRGESSYGAQTIALALEARTEFYEPRRDLRQSAPPESASGGKDLQVVALEEFVAVDEPGAVALVGDPDSALIPEGGDVMFYGDGGAGKTTLGIDLAYYLAAGDDWLSVTVARPLRVLVVENEGPRALFRRKLKRKVDGWTGSPLGGRLAVLNEPWGVMSFADPEWRNALAATVAELEIDFVLIGPVTRAGMNEAGTLQEVRDFMALVAQVRERSCRRVTIALVHHENRAGQVSGAWEGAVDTLLHVTAQGHGRTRLHVQKARWSSEHHKLTLHLTWADGEGFAIEDKPELDDATVAEQILAALRANPGLGWT
jgi:putative DNA primase/helicase